MYAFQEYAFVMILLKLLAFFFSSFDVGDDIDSKSASGRFWNESYHLTELPRFNVNLIYISVDVETSDKFICIC